MTEEVDKRLDRLLEVDVVLPERIVAVDQEELAVGLRSRRLKATSGTTGLAVCYEGLEIDPWRAGHWTT